MKIIFYIFDYFPRKKFISRFLFTEALNHSNRLFFHHLILGIFETEKVGLKINVDKTKVMVIKLEGNMRMDNLKIRGVKESIHLGSLVDASNNEMKENRRRISGSWPA